MFRWGRGSGQEGVASPSRALEGLGVESIVCGSKIVIVLTENGVVLSMDLGVDSDYAPTVSIL